MKKNQLDLLYFPNGRPEKVDKQGASSSLTQISKPPVSASQISQMNSIQEYYHNFVEMPMEYKLKIRELIETHFNLGGTMDYDSPEEPGDSGT
ncbi:hypothetical protein JTB14_004738 [Gonioctena quinquepunctata]|nr:hypothetical protein JTB14_004738 [Gonioctena quinquepunctata]